MLCYRAEDTPGANLSALYSACLTPVLIPPGGFLFAFRENTVGRYVVKTDKHAR